MRTAGLCLAGLWLVACGETSDRRCPAPDTDIRFPEDEAPHAMDMEWWYYTGHLWIRGGDRYGFELSFFQTFANGQVGYAGHFAVSDPQRRVHVFDQHIEAPQAIYPSFDLRVGDWTMRGDGERDRLQAGMQGYAIDLTCTRVKPVAYHGERGLIDMGADLVSFYYSKTRLEVAGDLQLASGTEPVTGVAWMDHQWGDFDVFASDGWDWFSIQLDDQTEIMAFMLHFKEGGTGLTGGSFVDRHGCRQAFADLETEVLGEWESPHTGAVYPHGWKLTIPSLEIALRIEPTFEDQELDSRATTLNVYWEGEVEAEGTRRGQPVEGLGYVELAGYGPWGPGS